MYFLNENGKTSERKYTLEQLRRMDICVGDDIYDEDAGEWKKAEHMPEIRDVIKEKRDEIIPERSLLYVFKIKISQLQISLTQFLWKVYEHIKDFLRLKKIFRKKKNIYITLGIGLFFLIYCIKLYQEEVIENECKKLQKEWDDKMEYLDNQLKSCNKIQDDLEANIETDSIQSLIPKYQLLKDIDSIINLYQKTLDMKSLTLLQIDDIHEKIEGAKKKQGDIVRDTAKIIQGFDSRRKRIKAEETKINKDIESLGKRPCPTSNDEQ